LDLGSDPPPGEHVHVVGLEQAIGQLLPLIDSGLPGLLAPALFGLRRLSSFLGAPLGCFTIQPVLAGLLRRPEDLRQLLLLSALGARIERAVLFLDPAQLKPLQRGLDFIRDRLT
jgi:hypothetical protein